MYYLYHVSFSLFFDLLKMKLRVGYEFFHNMQNYVHYPIHFVIMLIFFFHLLLFTIYYFHYMYYCLIVYMLIFFCKIPEELFFPLYICICLLHLFFNHVHLFCRVPALLYVLLAICQK